MDATVENAQRSPRITQQLRQVHTITDRFSMANTYLINDERVVIVDPGSERNVRLALAYLQQFLHRSANDIDLIVLTHLHPDHTAGIDFLRRACSAPVSAAAQQVVPVEAREKQPIPGITHLAGQILNQASLPGALHHLDLFPPHYASHVKTIDLWLKDVAGLPHHPAWRVIASPGHTPESLCLYNPFSYELLCGDTLITSEGGAPLLRGTANRRQLQETLRTLRSLQVYYLYPGHGRSILAKRPLHNISIEW